MARRTRGGVRPIPCLPHLLAVYRGSVTFTLNWYDAVYRKWVHGVSFGERGGKLFNTSTPLSGAGAQGAILRLYRLFLPSEDLGPVTPSRIVRNVEGNCSVCVRVLNKQGALDCRQNPSDPSQPPVFVCSNCLLTAAVLLEVPEPQGP